ncbi:Peroxygenase [Ananas comosus]|uniref:Peroxygenase n=1 Tax=Ananas comosus TaxID=4615 RepID=A0A199W1G2_ANACO|nr:Peroxygenase [Ananas comosus]
MDCRSDPSLATEAACAPVTKERKLNLDLQQELPKPYLARALVAVDPSHPNGTEGWDNRNMSVLQQHAAFFDRNGDGKIYPWETYQGMDTFSSLSHLHKKHPQSKAWKVYKQSDSETYDTEGRFDPSKFDAIFKWELLYSLGKDEKGLLHRETVRSVFDGSLFVQLELKNKKKMIKSN